MLFFKFVTSKISCHDKAEILLELVTALSKYETAAVF
jgi:hypothetical protein